MAEFKYNDGGRKAAGYKGETGDCVCRAIAIVTGKAYAEIYARLAEGNKSERNSKSNPKRRNRSPSNGVFTQRKWFKDYMLSLGFKWTPTMHVGSGCKVHLKASELPKGKIIASVSRHYVAIIDGIINDTHDCSRLACLSGLNIRPLKVDQS